MYFTLGLVDATWNFGDGEWILSCRRGKDVQVRASLIRIEKILHLFLRFLSPETFHFFHFRDQNINTEFCLHFCCDKYARAASLVHSVMFVSKVLKEFISVYFSEYRLF